MDAHGQHRPQPCAGGHADQVRVGQRVAEEALVGRAAPAQRRAGQQDQRRARQADAPDDQRGCLQAGGGLAREQPGQTSSKIGRRNEDRPDGDGEKDCQGEEERVQR